jgi:hypothetical protein
MKKLITIGIALAMLATMILPVAALAETTTVDATVLSPTVAVVAPTNAGLGNLDYKTNEYQWVTQATDGSVTVSNLGEATYTLTVKGDATNLTCTSPAGTFANALQIATGGAGMSTVGIVNTADDLMDGLYVDPTTAVVPVSVTDAAIVTAGTDSIAALKLTVYQHMNVDEHPAAGTYTIILTYTGTLNY